MFLVAENMLRSVVKYFSGVYCMSSVIIFSSFYLKKRLIQVVKFKMFHLDPFSLLEIRFLRYHKFLNFVVSKRYDTCKLFCFFEYGESIAWNISVLEL